MSGSLRGLLVELAGQTEAADLSGPVRAGVARTRRRRRALAVTGAALGALLLLGFGAYGLVVRTLSPAPEPGGPVPASGPVTPGASASPNTSTPAELAAVAQFFGTWSGHGRDLVVAPDRTASYTARTYVTCGNELVGQPCDSGAGLGYEKLSLVLIYAQGQVLATVTRSNDSTDGVGTVYQLRQAPDHTFAMVWLRGGSYSPAAGFEITMCSPTLTSPARSATYCGL